MIICVNQRHLREAQKNLPQMPLIDAENSLFIFIIKIESGNWFSMIAVGLLISLAILILGIWLFRKRRRKI